MQKSGRIVFVLEVCGMVLGVYSVSYVTDDKDHTTIDNNSPLALNGKDVPTTYMVCIKWFGMTSLVDLMMVALPARESI